MTLKTTKTEVLPVSFRWTPEFVAEIDKAKGDVSRTIFVRRAVERAIEQGKGKS